MRSRSTRVLGRMSIQRLATFAAATIAAAAVAACGSASKPSSSSSASGTGASTGAAKASSTGAASAPTNDGTLHLQFTAPVSMNPALGGTSESDIVYGALDYDSLIYQTGSGKFIPDLATKWAYVPGSKNEKFKLTLRSGVHFSDGSPMTPKSVADSLLYFKRSGGQQAPYLATMTSAKPAGAHDVLLTFSAPAPDLPFLLSQYQNAGQVIGPKGVANPKILTTTSDGTGPYILSASQSVANSQYTFTKNPHYWNPSAVHYNSVQVKVIADPQTALSSTQAGQLDAALQLPAASESSARADGLQVFAEPFSIEALFMMDRGGAISPLGKLAVRQAINLAINRKALAQGVGGQGSIATDQFSIPGEAGYDPALANKYPFDVAKAKQMLASAGYPHGFTLKVLDCEALDANGDAAAALKQELAAIGVTLQITEESTPAQFVPVSLSKKYPAVIWPISQNGTAGFPYAVEFAQTPFTNAWNSSSPQLTKLMATAGSAPESAQAAGYRKVNDFLTDNAWYAPMFSLTGVLVVGKNVANVQPTSVQNTTIDPISPNAKDSWYPASGS